VTNYYRRPYFILALASAVFALDPKSTANANNFAAAIITAGEYLYSIAANAAALASYQKDAESGFLYAMAISMQNEAWTDESLTPIINLGNLYIDMGKLEEARSLFQAARKISPYSWDAALGMAAYFQATGQPEQARVILSDDALDRPAIFAAMRRSQKSLGKSNRFADVPPESADSVYEEGIKAMAAEPVATAADFMAQLDQNERNKMRYFIEHLPPQGSFIVPSIRELTQYASLQAISSPQGIGALEDFNDRLKLYSLSSAAVSGISSWNGWPA
jgi:tetratricopeptide (TPR) repeat protein